jgi:hypothetical protein
MRFNREAISSQLENNNLRRKHRLQITNSKEQYMKRQANRFTFEASAIALAMGLLLMTTSVYATDNARERRDARDTKQESRQDARSTKIDCRQEDNKSNAECRQDKRQDKQDGRKDSREVRSGNETPKDTPAE